MDSPDAVIISGQLIHDPFGMMLSGRSWYAGGGEGYRFGFNGQEQINDLKGNGNCLSFTFRIYDSRICRFFTVDPLSADYPYNSPYAFCENDVIACKDLEGLERYYSADGQFIGQVGKCAEIRIISNENLVEGTKWVQWAIGTSNAQRHDAAKYNNNQAIRLSLPYHLADQSSQSNVSLTIFNDINSEIPANKMEVSQIDNGTGGKTTAVGEFVAYPQLTQNGEFINDNYYNQYNIWTHENEHSKYRKDGIESSNAFIHFSIEQTAYNDPSFANTTPNYKIYTQSVFEGYLSYQKSYLLNSLYSGNNAIDIYNSYNYQYYLNEYTENIKWFNNAFGTNFVIEDFNARATSIDKPKE